MTTRNKPLEMVDLFCCAGGTSTGIIKAAKRKKIKIRLYAINHDAMSIATHKLNHRSVIHIKDDLEVVDPRKVIKSGKLFLLTASPECTYFSNALGGKPLNKQSRATSKYVIKWIRSLDVENFWMENVPEFQGWGPLTPCVCGTKDPKKHGKKCFRPVPEKKGIYFKAFIRAIKREGYDVRYTVLNTANYGDPTTRKRFFLLASKKSLPQFPQATHTEYPEEMPLFDMKKWKPARDIINWNEKGISIYRRKEAGKKPLVPNTHRRIYEGFLRHGGGAFILGQHSGSVPRSVEKPTMTICSEGALQLVQPFIYKMDQGGSLHSIDKPLPTITSAYAQTLVQPFLVKYYGTAISAPIDKPLPTLTSKEHLALVEPMIVEIDDETFMLDFYYRMFMVEELAAAMSFPKSYKFVGNIGDQVKQIGNAVPVLTAQKLTEVFL